MSHLLLYCLDVHSFKDTGYSPTCGRVLIFQKGRNLKGQLETSLGESVWGLIGGGGRCLQGNLWYSPPASMTSRLASVTFKMASKVFIEETDKNFDFITEILFRFLGFGDFKVSIVIEN